MESSKNNKNNIGDIFFLIFLALCSFAFAQTITQTPDATSPNAVIETLKWVIFSMVAGIGYTVKALLGYLPKFTDALNRVEKVLMVLCAKVGEEKEAGKLIKSMPIKDDENLD